MIEHESNLPEVFNNVELPFDPKSIDKDKMVELKAEKEVNSQETRE